MLSLLMGIALIPLLPLTLHSSATPLPAFEDWQRAALAPEDVGTAVLTAIDLPAEGRDAYVRVMVGRGTESDLQVTVAVVSGDRGPGEGQGVLVASDVDAPIERVPGVMLPASFGADAFSQTTLTVRTRRQQVVSIVQWRHGGWIVTVGVSSSEPLESVHGAILVLAERQREKLAAVFAVGK